MNGMSLHPYPKGAPVGRQISISPVLVDGLLFLFCSVWFWFWFAAVAFWLVLFFVVSLWHGDSSFLDYAVLSQFNFWSSSSCKIDNVTALLQSRSLSGRHGSTSFLDPVLGAMMKQVCWKSGKDVFARIRLSLLHQAQKGRQELIKKDGGEMLVSIVLDRPLADSEAKALVNDRLISENFDTTLKSEPMASAPITEPNGIQM